MPNEYREAKPHSALNKAGSAGDKADREDSMFGGIGRHYPPMVQTAPINFMTTPHFVTNCPSCNAAIKWDYGENETGNCAGCFTPLKTGSTGHPVVA